MKRSLIAVWAFAAALCLTSASIAWAQNVNLELPKDEPAPKSGGFAAANAESSLYKDTEANSPLDRKVSIRVASVPIATFLNSISAQAKINFIMSEEFANKKVTASLNNITVREALDTLLRVQGLTYQRIGKSDSYVVTKRSSDSPNTITKVYTLNYISLQGSNSTGNTNSPQSTFASSLNVNPNEQRSDMENLAEMVTDSARKGATGSDFLTIIQSVMSSQGKIAIDPRTNKLIVTDIPEIFPQLENILAELDIKPPQVLIEAQIIEVNKSSGLEIGLSYGGTDGTIFKFTGPARGVDIDYVKGNGVSGWGYIFPPAGTGTGGSSGGDSGGGSTDGSGGNSNSPKDAFLDFSSFSIVLKSLLTRGEAKYLGKPKVVTINNQPAVIESTRDAAVGFASNLSGNTGSTNVVSQTAERKTVGLTLKVTPQVNKEGYITLLIEPSYSSVANSAVSDGTKDTLNRSASTLVRVKNGQTVVLGGLLSSREILEDRKVPLLGDIPLIGWLFTQRSTTKETTDMVIFVTPTILAD
ncbi:Putatively involved in type II secretion system [Elusimicrobium minutum Pei191]|uniref:Putatively involved in type II secretion system n=1 Tax=Elusimicrobium minutum (strain Pei191) TaxID=445932 RepID=B2KC06_ELUMP|nr:secretin N-terminal domain-containing protein [Elusimicrobium minutum]ACC98133.1 Putatively involved in type II secretion system [Elusimicrobium minutum Pei191]